MPRGLALALLLSVIGLLPSQSLSQMAQGQRKFVGNVITNGSNIRSDFPTYWNAVTAENAGKWGNVEGSPGSYNWTALDNIYNYAVSCGYRYRHHCLIWGAQQPSFMTSLDSAQQYQRIVAWFQESGQRYLSAAFCDVVNEPLHQPPSYRNALGGNGATGWDWVIRAFQLARQYWPYTKLHLNEYGIVNDGNATTQYLQIISLLQTRGLIDGIGIQGHRFEIESPALATMRDNLNRLAATGLPIYITEFDLGNIGNSGTPNDSVQLALYQQRFSLFWEHPGVKGITLWGYVQGVIWQTSCYLVRSDNTERPALEWLRLYLRAPLPPGIVSPSGTTGEPRNPLMVWNFSPLATSHRVQVSTNSTFTSIVADSTAADTVLRINPLAANTTFYWRVSASNIYGVSSYSVTGSFTTGDQIVAVRGSGGIPTEFSLFQNYPNPFNPSTTIAFSLPRSSEVRLVLVNSLGQVVKDIASGNYEAGEHRMTVDASDLATGVYFYRLQAGEFVDMRKLVLIK